MRAPIPFQEEKKLGESDSTQPFGKEAKYLGIISDNRLTWNQHLQKKITKSEMTIMFHKREIWETWGLKPSVVHWCYTTVVRPMTRMVT